jgi:hypothetical protein
VEQPWINIGEVVGAIFADGPHNYRPARKIKLVVYPVVLLKRRIGRWGVTRVPGKVVEWHCKVVLCVAIVSTLEIPVHEPDISSKTGCSQYQADKDTKDSSNHG